ncbi:MAG: hypothetical protein IT462_02115 [Planctomycetes bacterium]|nr:hypothetical protein [Planctomycetota bacterium]
MSKVQFLLVLGFAGVMSLAGSFLAVNTLMGDKVHAKGTTEVLGGAGSAVVATKFQLQDADGNVRGGFAVADDGQVVFTIFDKKGNARITQSLKDEDAVIAVTDRKLRPRLSMTSSKDFPGCFIAYDRRGNPGAMMVTDDDGMAGIELQAKENKSRIQIQAQETGTSVIQLKSNEKLRGQFMTDADGNPQIVLADEDQNIIWSAPKK